MTPLVIMPVLPITMINNAINWRIILLLFLSDDAFLSGLSVVLWHEAGAILKRFLLF